MICRTPLAPHSRRSRERACGGVSPGPGLRRAGRDRDANPWPNPQLVPQPVAGAPSTTASSARWWLGTKVSCRVMNLRRARLRAWLDVRRRHRGRDATPAGRCARDSRRGRCRVHCWVANPVDGRYDAPVDGDGAAGPARAAGDIGRSACPADGRGAADQNLPAADGVVRHHTRQAHLRYRRQPLSGSILAACVLRPTRKGSAARRLR